MNPILIKGLILAGAAIVAFWPDKKEELKNDPNPDNGRKRGGSDPSGKPRKNSTQRSGRTSRIKTAEEKAHESQSNHSKPSRTHAVRNDSPGDGGGSEPDPAAGDREAQPVKDQDNAQHEDDLSSGHGDDGDNVHSQSTGKS